MAAAASTDIEQTTAAKVGDRVAWIAWERWHLGGGWRNFQGTVTAVEGNILTVDAEISKREHVGGHGYEMRWHAAGERRIIDSGDGGVRIKAPR